MSNFSPHSYGYALLKELVEAVEAGKPSPSDALIGYAFRSHVAQYRKILDALDGPKWTQVSERMPESSPDQLLMIAYETSDGIQAVAVGTYDEGWSYDCEEERDTVQQWYPVPPAPATRTPLSGEQSGDVRKSEDAKPASVGIQMPRDGSTPSAAHFNALLDRFPDAPNWAYQDVVRELRQLFRQQQAAPSESAANMYQVHPLKPQPETITTTSYNAGQPAVYIPMNSTPDKNEPQVPHTCRPELYFDQECKACVTDLAPPADALQVLRELERAALRMAQCWNKSDARGEGVTVAEMNEARQGVDVARKKALAVLKQAAPSAIEPTKHDWQPDDGVLKFESHPGTEAPHVHATCTKCKGRAWFTELQWEMLSKGCSVPTDGKGDSK